MVKKGSSEVSYRFLVDDSRLVYTIDETLLEQGVTGGTLRHQRTETEHDSIMEHVK